MYEKQNFSDGSVLTAEQLNHMETGIAEAHDALPKKLTKPETAKVGNYLRVKTVNEDGSLALEAVELPVSEGSGENADQMDSIFAGKTASFYGDSLTEANYHYTKGYHSWVKDILGLVSYNNYGKSGYKVSDVYNKVNSVNDTADIIFVMCGVNDQNFHVPLGTIGDTTSGTTYGALDMLCSLLKQKYPTKLLVFITPHYQTKYPHNSGVTSYEVSKAVREVCEKYAIPVYDNFVLSGIYSTNLSTFTTDNCHWNDTAHEMVGKNLARFMVNTFRYIHDNTAGGDTHTHSYTSAVTTEPTCTSKGVRTHICSCGDTYTEEIPMIDHNYANGVCTVCGVADPNAEPDAPEVTLSSISATFNQGDVVIYDSDTLDSLRQYLTVTANYSDGTAETITDYTLSGTLAESTSVITVAYSGKNTTFYVTVTIDNNPVRVINNSCTASYENNILTLSNHASTFVGVEFPKATKVEITPGSGTGSGLKTGWVLLGNDTHYKGVSLMDTGVGEVWDVSPTLAFTNRETPLLDSAINPTKLTAEIIGGTIHLYADDTELYSAEGNIIGLAGTAAKFCNLTVVLS